MGAERRAWLEKRLELAGEIGRLLGEVSKIETLREEARDGCVPESVRDWVTERIALEHPSLVAACTERERVHWEQTNQARLDALESSRDGRGGEERSTERRVAR